MAARETQIPEDVTVDVSKDGVTAKGPNGEVSKRFKTVLDVKLEKTDDKVRASSESSDRETKAMLGTMIAHVRNAVQGVTQGYTYRMKVVYSHFPVTVEVEGDKVLVKNFLGERTPRVAKIVGNTKVDAKKQDITLTGPDVEEVSQTAANIESACKIVGYDKKVFQDGVYLTSRE